MMTFPIYGKIIQMFQTTNQMGIDQFTNNAGLCREIVQDFFLMTLALTNPTGKINE
jgi:hypothetical protein